METNRYLSETMANFTDIQMKWPLMSSPMPITFILLIYIYVIYFAGPQFMKNREPYSLKWFIQIYNLFQIVANFWIVFNLMTYGKPLAPVWRYCEPFEQICDFKKPYEILWWVLLLKIFDFIETVVFVLRKKDRQISFFHIYHHTSTAIYVWVTLRYFPYSFFMTMSTLNCFVHVLMYSYYFLSTFGLSMQQILSFKKWITIIQMSHILFLMVIATQGFMPNCGDIIMKYYSFMLVLDGIVNLLFFFDFYRSNYKKSKTA
jgi:hypothetical protein